MSRAGRRLTCGWVAGRTVGWRRPRVPLGCGGGAQALARAGGGSRGRCQGAEGGGGREVSPGRAGWKCLESLFSAPCSLEPSLRAYLEVLPAEERSLSFTWRRVLRSRRCEFLLVAPDAGGSFPDSWSARHLGAPLACRSTLSEVGSPGRPGLEAPARAA